MHLHELLACFAVISCAFVCVVVHPFYLCPIEFVFGFRVRTMVIHSGPFCGWEYGLAFYLETVC